MEESVKKLIERSASADKSEDAMRLSQAACNAANAICALEHAKGPAKGRQPDPSSR